MHKFLIKRAGRLSSDRFCRMLGQFGLQLVTNDSTLFERLGGDYSAADSAEIVFSSCIWRKRPDADREIDVFCFCARDGQSGSNPLYAFFPACSVPLHYPGFVGVIRPIRNGCSASGLLSERGGYWSQWLSAFAANRLFGIFEETPESRLIGIKSGFLNAEEAVQWCAKAGYNFSDLNIEC